MKLKLAIASLFATVGLATAVVPLAAADVNNFTVTNFAADETLTRADKQGELAITESINVTFTDNNHGILRSLPESYKGVGLKIHAIRVSSTSGAPSQFTTYKSNGNLVLKIGDPNSTVTGSQEYTISYIVDNVISFYKDHDELYWNVNGTDWGQPFEKVSATLHVPAGSTQTGFRCYAGSYGQNATDCITTENGNTMSAETTQPLLTGQTLTYVDGIQKGFFTAPTWRDWLADHWLQLMELVVIPLVTLVVCLTLWLKKGRDAKGRGTIVPEYGPPDNLKPLQVGTIADFKVDNRDITATIIDLAIRKYLKIIETTTDKLLGKNTSYTLELVNPDISALSSVEQKLILALFDNQMTAGQTADIAALRNTLYSTSKTISNQVETELTTLGYFTANPLKSGKTMAGISTVAIFVLFFAGSIFGPFLSIGLFIAAVIAYLTAKAMPSRTAKGVAAKEGALGLKLYLKTAEADRLKMLQGPNAAYADNAKEPVKTVDLFEKLLPYAMVLEVEKDWAKQFEGIYKQAPDWYAGNWTTFNAVYLASSLGSDMQSAVNAAFTAPHSSGSSGFGGGGFAGGGGGGGGGGGW